MALNINHAFNDWYRGESDSYWCTYHDSPHFNECECEEVADFANGLTSALVSDDAVDMDIWNATHSTDRVSSVEAD